MRTLPIVICTILCCIVACGCADKSYEEKKSLIAAVNRFYDTIITRDIAGLYSYFPETFTDTVSQKQFLTAVEGQSMRFVLNAFGLLEIKRYKIHSIVKQNDDSYRVTVHIYPEDTPNKMADIMTWQKQGESWVNVTYKELVANMIENAHRQQKDIVRQLFELKQCKNEMQELILATFDFVTSHSMTLGDFQAIEPDKWVSVLEKENKFVTGDTPRCPADGTYSVTYGRNERKLIFSCSKHASIAIPFEFDNMADSTANYPPSKDESSSP